MSAAQSYLDSHAARMHADAKTLAEVRVNIDHLRRRIADDQSNLDAAEQFEQVLIKVIAAGQRLLDEEWREDWKVGTHSQDSATPEYERALAAHAAAPDRTKGFEAVRVANPLDINADVLVCGHEDCGQELVCTDGGVYVHIQSGRAECHPVLPGLQEGTDGDPTKRTALPPHIAEEVRTDG